MRIGIVGHMGSGKSTMAEAFENHDFSRVSLAAPVRAVAKVLKECPENTKLMTLAAWANLLFPDSIYSLPDIRWRNFIADEVDPELFEHPPTTKELFVGLCTSVYEQCETERELLQMLGTDVGRMLNEEVWIHFLARHLHEGNVVIDDVRFANEGTALKDMGFKIIRVNAPEEVRIERNEARGRHFDPSQMAHASEQEIDMIEPDAFFDNTGHLQDIQDWVDNYVEKDGDIIEAVQGEVELHQVTNEPATA